MSDQSHEVLPDGKIEVLRCLDRALSVAFNGEAAAEFKSITRDQWRVLLMLQDGDGHAMSDVADRIGVPAATATRMVDGLVANTLVYRRTDPLDRRKVLVHLNSIHSDALDAAASRAWAVLTEAVSDLGGTGREALEMLLRISTAPTAPNTP